MKIAVLGANGRLAHAVAKAFLAAGHDVVAVTRSGRCEGLSGKVEFRAADAMNEADLIAATEGVDMIFNGLNPVYTEWKDKCLVMASNVMAAVKANRAVHLFIGNVYNYGKEIPMNADEATPWHATTEKAAIRIEMERLFEREARTHGVKTIILRAGDFYGTEKTGTWIDLIIATKLAKGVVTWPGPMNIPHEFAYLPDLAATFVRLAERHEALETFSNYTFAGHNMTGEVFLSHVEAAVGRKLKVWHVPWTLFAIIGLFSPLLREVRKMSYLWFTPHSLSGRKLDALLGPLHSTPARDAIRRTLQDLKLVGVSASSDLLASPA